MKKASLFLMLGIFVMAGNLLAQNWDKKYNIGGQANIIKLWGGAVNHSALGWQLGGHALYGITPNVQIGLEAGYGCSRPSETGRLIPDEDDLDFRTFVIPASLVMRAAIPNNTPVKPYGVLGLGAILWDLQNADKDSPDYGDSVHGRRTNATLLVGAGAEWFFADSWALDARAQNSFLLSQKLDNTGYGDDANSMMFQGRIGISFYFGGKKEAPQVPSAPTPTTPGAQATDRDDAAKNADVVQAPHVTPPDEVREESREQAPTAEPAFIPDQVDATLVLQGVNFQLGKDNLTEQAQVILDSVAKKLQDFPDVRVRIVGHTDNTGTEALNANLSIRRAESVKRYLVAQGIAENRLETAGRGDREPIATNATEEGRAQNRRIEFVRLQ